MTSLKQNIHLVGMPGAGKSTVGKSLAHHLGLTFVDADHALVERTGAAISTIFELEGEAGFRQREAQIVAELAHRHGILLATGGGAVLLEENRRVLNATGVVIYLHASLDHLWHRTRHDSRRPLLQGENPREILKALLETRDPLYRQVADMVVETGRQSIGKLIRQIADDLSRLDLSPVSISHVQTPARSDISP